MAQTIFRVSLKNITRQRTGQGKIKFLQNIRHFARRPCMNDMVLNPD